VWSSSKRGFEKAARPSPLVKTCRWLFVDELIDLLQA
jgi:hypothetical protein